MATLAPAPATPGDPAALLAAVEACTLAKPRWTHKAHLVFAAALIARDGLAGAEAAAPALIRRYNAATGVVNDDRGGYHETLTLFFLRRVARRLDRCADVGALLASPLGASDYPLAFYTRERLFSVAARRAFVAPDLRPLDAPDPDEKAAP